MPAGPLQSKYPMSSQARAAQSARQFFSPRGTLSRWHPNYEYRPGQLEMAEAVEAALAGRPAPDRRGRHGHRQDPGLPGPGDPVRPPRRRLHRHQEPCRSSSSSRTCPFLQQHFPQPLSVCYMKGRANYACRQKIYDAEKTPFLTGLEEVADFQIIEAWEKTTETGDRAEIRTLPENSSAWAKIDARREACTGKKCPQFERVLHHPMHQRAQESDIVVVNHHLFFADLALRSDRRTTAASHSPRLPGRGLRRGARDRRRGRPVLRHRRQQLPVRGAAARHRPPWPAPANSAPPSSTACWSASTSLTTQFFALFGAGDARAPFLAPRRFLEEHEKTSTATCSSRSN